MKKSKWSEEVKDYIIQEKILLKELENKFISKKWKEISKEFKNNGY